MECEYCLRQDGHDCRCPNYTTPEASHYCSICGQGIYSGDKYIRNDNDDLAHIECLDDIEDALDWLGFTVMTYYDD